MNELYRPGQKAPRSGIYAPSSGGTMIALSRGARFPPPASWRLHFPTVELGRSPLLEELRSARDRAASLAEPGRTAALAAFGEAISIVERSLEPRTETEP